MALPNPISENILKNVISTVAIATIPNSSGVIRRAKIAVTPNCTITLEYLATAFQNTPFIISFFTDIITLVLSMFVF